MIQLRDNSINGFRVNSIRKKDTENTLSVKPFRFLLKRLIPVNPNNLFFILDSETERLLNKRVKYPYSKERRVIYYEFLKLDQAGAIVIYSINI